MEAFFSRDILLLAVHLTLGNKNDYNFLFYDLINSFWILSAYLCPYMIDCKSNREIDLMCSTVMELEFSQNSEFRIFLIFKVQSTELFYWNLADLVFDFEVVIYVYVQLHNYNFEYFFDDISYFFSKSNTFFEVCICIIRLEYI